MTDNIADAFNIKEGSDSYLKFVTTNGSEAVVLGKDIGSFKIDLTAKKAKACDSTKSPSIL